MLSKIYSQHHPFSNIDDFIVAFAKLSQIKTMYNLDEELSLHPKKAEVLCGSFSHPSCTSLSSCSTETTFLTTRLICSPSTPVSLINNSAIHWEQITIHFVTCFRQNVNTELFIQTEDSQDATYVQVCMHSRSVLNWLGNSFEYNLLVNCNTHLCCTAPDWEEKSFYTSLLTTDSLPNPVIIQLQHLCPPQLWHYLYLHFLHFYPLCHCPLPWIIPDLSNLSTTLMFTLFPLFLLWWTYKPCLHFSHITPL